VTMTAELLQSKQSKDHMVSELRFLAPLAGLEPATCCLQSFAVVGEGWDYAPGISRAAISPDGWGLRLLSGVGNSAT
jgi:hypothetical protein